MGKTNLKRIVSMLTRLIQRTQTVSESSIEFEYEYRDAEYEYEKKPEQSVTVEPRNLAFSSGGCNHSAH